MAWNKESERHALASRGIKTATNYVLKESPANKKGDIKKSIEFPNSNGKLTVKTEEGGFVIRAISSILKVKAPDNGELNYVYIIQIGKNFYTDRDPKHRDSYMTFFPDTNSLEVLDTRIELGKDGSKNLEKTLEKLLDVDLKDKKSIEEYQKYEKKMLKGYKPKTWSR